VLAALALDPGRPVPIETLIDRVWADEPPTEAPNVLYSHLSRIRQLFKQATDLGDGTAVRLERRHAGYVLTIDPDLVDLHRFRRLADQGRDPSRTNAERASGRARSRRRWASGEAPPAAGLSGEWVANVRGAPSRSLQSRRAARNVQRIPNTFKRQRPAHDHDADLNRSSALSATLRGQIPRTNRLQTIKSPTAILCDRASDLHFLVAGAGFEPATSGL
jgi:hypothetical protein